MKMFSTCVRGRNWRREQSNTSSGFYAPVHNGFVLLISLMTLDIILAASEPDVAVRGVSVYIRNWINSHCSNYLTCRNLLPKIA